MEKSKSIDILPFVKNQVAPSTEDLQATKKKRKLLMEQLAEKGMPAAASIGDALVDATSSDTQDEYLEKLTPTVGAVNKLPKVNTRGRAIEDIKNEIYTLEKTLDKLRDKMSVPEVNAYRQKIVNKYKQIRQYNSEE